jgi:hypothetical protein
LSVTAAMARISHLRRAAVICLAGGLAWHGVAATAPMPNPDDVTVAGGVFRNEYFNLSYPLPHGWMESLAGPGASVSGYYVLGTFVPASELTGTIVVAAQDIFFAAAPLDDVMAMADEVGRAMARIDGMHIDRPPVEVHIAGRRFGRIDFSGVGLFRSTLITKLRCHFLSFNLTAKSPELLSALVLSLNKLTAVNDNETARNDPTCIGGYADADHLLTRVDPPPVSPSFTPIPVRIVIGADGTVQHVHVIHATAAQRDGIEAALGRWKLRPLNLNGVVGEIETGLVINFTPAGAVRYLPGNRLQ